MSKLRSLGKLPTGLGSLPQPTTAGLSNTNHRARGAGATGRGYTYRWEQYRLGFLQLHPFCCYCLRADPNSAVLATVVDHIVPHQGNMNLFWNPENHQALCKHCHDVVKAAEERAAGYRV